MTPQCRTVAIHTERQVNATGLVERAMLEYISRPNLCLAGTQCDYKASA